MTINEQFHGHQSNFSNQFEREFEMFQSENRWKRNNRHSFSNTTELTLSFTRNERNSNLWTIVKDRTNRSSSIDLFNGRQRIFNGVKQKRSEKKIDLNSSGNSSMEEQWNHNSIRSRPRRRRRRISWWVNKWFPWNYSTFNSETISITNPIEMKIFSHCTYRRFRTYRANHWRSTLFNHRCIPLRERAMWGCFTPVSLKVDNRQLRPVKQVKKETRRSREICWWIHIDKLNNTRDKDPGSDSRDENSLWQQRPMERTTLKEESELFSVPRIEKRLTSTSTERRR